MFFDQLKQLCKQRGTTPTALAKDLNISTSNVTSWKNGASPKFDIVMRIADALQVPVSAFASFQDATAQISSSLLEDETELLELYRRLKKSGKRQLIGKAYELFDAQNASHAGDALTPPDIDMAVTVIDSRIKK